MVDTDILEVLDLAIRSLETKLIQRFRVSAHVEFNLPDPELTPMVLRFGKRGGEWGLYVRGASWRPDEESLLASMNIEVRCEAANHIAALVNALVIADHAVVERIRVATDLYRAAL